jgi:hypothetical protein
MIPSDFSFGELMLRRDWDYKCMLRLHTPPQYTVTAHRTAEDAVTGFNEITEAADARYAEQYRVQLRCRTLIGPGQYGDVTRVRIDVSGAGYPMSSPSVWPLDTPLPWSPHFAEGAPVCLGSFWRAEGSRPLAELVVHIARLLNWDEMLSPGYMGWNPEAIEWWRRHVNQPLTPHMVYPKLPEDLLYGDVSQPARAKFRPLSSTGQFATRSFHGFRAVHKLQADSSIAPKEVKHGKFIPINRHR